MLCEFFQSELHFTWRLCAFCGGCGQPHVEKQQVQQDEQSEDLPVVRLPPGRCARRPGPCKHNGQHALQGEAQRMSPPLPWPGVFFRDSAQFERAARAAADTVTGAATPTGVCDDDDPALALAAAVVCEPQYAVRASLRATSAARTIVGVKFEFRFHEVPSFYLCRRTGGGNIFGMGGFLYFNIPQLQLLGCLGFSTDTPLE